MSKLCALSLAAANERDRFSIDCLQKSVRVLVRENELLMGALIGQYHYRIRFEEAYRVLHKKKTCCTS